MRASALLLTLLLAAPLAAQSAPEPTAADIDAHIRFLASDRLEGRAPGSRAGEIAADYIASYLRTLGLKPGAGDSYFQDVPIDLVAARRESLRASYESKGAHELRFPDDVVVWAGSAVERSGAKGEVVFIGYGAAAPEYRWDDFKGVDVKGKILLVLVNDPPAPAGEPELFGGKAMTWYGRWPYKFEEAERRGAAGMLVVHTTERAGYPWHTVVGSWADEQRMLPRDSTLPPALGFRGWITDSAATAMLASAGLDLANLRKLAESRDFKPVATGITVDVAFTNTVARLASRNVIGILPGALAAEREHYVVLSAHWDHLGIGPAVNGDSIYNGALDNASGVADLLAIAHAAARGPRPKRSLMFLFVTAEESGLLGSEWFAQHPTVPIGSLVANLNVDEGNLLGRLRDLSVLGERKSSLGPLIARLIKPDGMRLSPEEHPEAGEFYRSDHFAFARAGIPAVSINQGSDFRDHPAGWGRQQIDDFLENRYHQPSDEYKGTEDLRGAVQLSSIVLRVARSLANTTAWPTWNADAEFHRPK